MDGGSIDDVRKKRDSRDVVERNALKSSEKPKKLRSRRMKTADTSLCNSTDSPKQQNSKPTTTKCSDLNEDIGNFSVSSSVSVGLKSSTPEGSNKTPNAFPFHSNCLDIETALANVVQASDKVPEPVSELSWISFRVGHAGDISALATLIRKSDAIQPKQEERNDKVTQIKQHSVTSLVTEDSSLEVRLADGLGDEDNPPSIFAVLVDIHTNDKESKLVAGALVSLTWEESSKVLYIEWMYVDKDVLGTKDLIGVIERRLWLRICTLSVVTSCEKVVGKKPCVETIHNIN